MIGREAILERLTAAIAAAGLSPITTVDQEALNLGHEGGEDSEEEVIYDQVCG